MKRSRVATRGSTRRVLRRKNVVVDEEDASQEEEESQEEEQAEAEEKEETPPPKLTRGQAKKQEAERRKGTRGRGGRKPQLSGMARQLRAKPPPRKKQRRKIIDSEDEEAEEEEDEAEEEDEEEEDEEEEDEEEDDEEEEEEEEEDEEAEVEEVKPPQKKTTPRGTRAAEKRPAPAKRTPRGKRPAQKNVEESSESEQEKEPEQQQEKDEESEAKDESASEPPSAAATPASSPVKRKGLSIDTLMNDAADEEDEPEEQADVDMTPASASASASDAGTDADEVPDQHLRDALDGATSGPQLMEVLTEACGRLIREGKSPSRLFSVGLLSVVKEDPKRFGQPAVLKYLLRLLRSKHYVGMKDPSDHGKKLSTAIALGSGHLSGSTEFSQLSLPVLVTNLLVQILKDVDEWPVDSIKVFLDDSLYSRVWVDHELSQLFVQNVKTVLEAGESSQQQPTKPLVRKRFQGSGVAQEMKDLITNHIRTRLGELDKEKPGSVGGSSGVGGNHAVRNMIMTLADFASIPQVRLFGAENMESWLQNPSVKGPAKELLNKIVALCKSTSSQDIATVDMLLKLKLKSTMFQLKVEAITHLVCNNPVYLKRALAMFIARERPNNMARDVDNIKMLQHIFRASRSLSASSILGSPDDLFYRRPIEHQGTLASRELARVFREMASVSEVAPVLKTIVRKILKQLTFEQVDIKALCVGILDNDGHWDALAGDARVLDYMGLVTGVVWLILLMRGAAVKSLQIQQSNASNRQGTGSTVLGSTGLKHGGTQAIPRRGSNPPLPVSRTSRLGPSKNKQVLGKTPLHSATHSSLGNAGVASSHGPSGSTSGGVSSEGSKTVKISVWAKEELQQALAFVQREAIICCRDVLKHFGLNGDSPFEKMLYEGIVKKLLFLDIPPDVQPTEHDRTCFQSTKEDIPVHEDSLELLTSLYNSCRAIDRMEALRTLETMVFRGAEAHIRREALWRHHEDDLAAYAQSGGVLGIEVKNSQFVDQLLKLALWQGGDEKQEQEFCHSSRFWICCSILLIVGCFNPNTVGTFLWEEFPTLRGLMQMVITGRYTFPAISAPDPLLLGKHRAAFPDLMQGNLQLRDYEQQLLQLNQGDPSVTGDPLMLFDASGLARQPPPAIFEHLRTLDRKFKLGMRLRQSRKKDFLMEMVSGNDDKNAVQNGNPAGAAANSAWWIADIVCEDFDTVQYLPYGCLCQLLLLALRPKKTAESPEQAPLNQPALTQIVPRLLTKLREYLADRNDSSGVASNVILYYLECLNSSEVATRRVAAHILYLLTASRSVEELAEEIHQVVAASGEGTLSFLWLRELSKLPCYRSIRSRIFHSLETLLELEASIPSLRMCIKALHDFSHDGGDGIDSTNDGVEIKQDDGGSHPKKSAVEQSLLLAGAYGRLLAGRDLVATLLLKDHEIYAITVDVIWRAIEAQLEIAPKLKAASGISFSDCKVFYVKDGATTIREIKLPLPIIHGAIQVLCSPHAHKDPAALSSDRTAICTSKLTQSLFPKASSNATIVSSTGLIATKDSRLYPDHLLTKLAAATSSITSRLCATAVRAMSSEALWNLLEQSALSEQCLEMALRLILDLAHKNESKAVASLLAVTNASDVSAAADTVLTQLSAYDMVTSLTSGVNEKLKRVRQWLHERTSTGSSSGMVTDDDDEEALLLSEGFTTFKIRAAEAPIEPFYTEPMAEPIQKRSPCRTTKARTDMAIFEESYFCSSHVEDSVSRSGSDDSVPLLKGLVKELKRSSSTGSVPDIIPPEDFVYAASLAVRKSCPKEESASARTPADFWTLQMSLLHFTRSSCNSEAAAAQLAKALLLIVDHLPTCPSADHRKECIGFVRRALDNLGGERGSYAAYVSFIRHLAQASTADGLYTLEDPTVASDVHAVLLLVVQFIERSVARWKAHGESLRFDAMTLHGLVVLVKEVEVLQRIRDNDCEASGAMSLLSTIAQDHINDTTMLNLLDPIMTADPHLGALGDVSIHGDVKRDLIGMLYFQNPKLVSGLLDMLNPDWESFVNFDMSADHSKELVIRDRRLLEQVDDILRDLTREGSEVMERFRELTRCHPMLVLSRFLRQLMQHFGTVSLSQLYLNTTFFQNILSALQIVRPHMRHRQSVLEPFCQFLFEILRVIADHHAVEFHQLVSHSWEFFYDALEADFDLASELLFSPPRVLLLESIVAMYESQPETVAFGEVLAQRHSEWSLRSTLESIRAGRGGKHNPAATQQQQIEQLLAHIDSQEAVPTTGGKPLAERSDMSAVTQGLQAIDILCAKTDQGATVVALLRRCAAPVASLLVTEIVTKAVMAALCQTLLNLMKYDSSCVDDVMRQYVQCLRAVRPGLKEAAVNAVLDFLVFADARQRRQILQQLFDDSSEIAKSKLGVYLKSAAFRTTLLVASNTK